MPGPGSAARRASDATTAGEHAFGMKQKRGVAPMARPKIASARRAGIEDSPVPRTKRVKVTDDDVAIKVPANAAQEHFKKRVAVEFDALCQLVKKAEVLSRGKNGRSLPRPEAPVVASHKEPPAKRRKMSPPVEKIQMDSVQHMLPEEGEIVVVPEEDEDYIDICGGVSPVATRHASPLVSLEKVGDQSKINIVPAEEQEEFVDIRGGTPLAPLKVANEVFSPMYNNDSGSSSSNDSDSGSDSDDDESVDSQTPEAVPPPKENSSPTEPVETVTISSPAASEAAQSTKPEIHSNDKSQQPGPAPGSSREERQSCAATGADIIDGASGAEPPDFCSAREGKGASRDSGPEGARLGAGEDLPDAARDGEGGAARPEHRPAGPGAGWHQTVRLRPQGRAWDLP
jgi:hypothetical protein